MANYLDHLNQAEHNESFAAQLDANPNLQHWDWLITVAFYAAVHYVEALFFFHNDIVHTELACPEHDKHAFRARKVRALLGDKCWRSYRKLQDASYNARYLAFAQPTKIAVQYYSRNDAKNMYSIHLATMRDAVKQQLAR
jgi:hypothetical protein